MFATLVQDNTLAAITLEAGTFYDGVRRDFLEKTSLFIRIQVEMEGVAAAGNNG